MSAYWCVGQRKHAVCPAVGEYFPTAHGKHVPASKPRRRRSAVSARAPHGRERWRSEARASEVRGRGTEACGRAHAECAA
eukprot:3287540-Prymnesium_polylepis.1